MNEILEAIGKNFILVFAVFCYTVYEIFQSRCGSRSRLEKYEALRLLNELREKGVITQDEFDDKKMDLLSD